MAASAGRRTFLSPSNCGQWSSVQLVQRFIPYLPSPQTHTGGGCLDTRARGGWEDRLFDHIYARARSVTHIPTHRHCGSVGIT